MDCSFDLFLYARFTLANCFPPEFGSTVIPRGRAIDLCILNSDTAKRQKES